MRLTVDDGRISAVRERGKPAVATCDCAASWSPASQMPPHLFRPRLRSHPRRGGKLWSWRDEMYAWPGASSPRVTLALARAVFPRCSRRALRLLANSTTYHQPGGRGCDEPNAMGEALVQAARDIGIRLTLLDTIYLHGGLTPQGHLLPLDEVQIRFGDCTVDQWAERVTPFRDALGGDPAVRVGAAARSVRALTPTELDAFGGGHRWLDPACSRLRAASGNLRHRLSMGAPRPRSGLIRPPRRIPSRQSTPPISRA